MIATLRPLTYEDFLDLPDDGLRYEIIGGELVETPAPSWNHQRVLGELYRLVDDFLRETGMGSLVFAPFDVILGHHDIVGPDLVVIGSDQGRVPGTQNSFDGPPLLVVEAISPSSRQTDLVKKMALYARAGVVEYWVADPQHRKLVINVLAAGKYDPMPANADGSFASRALPGLHVDPAEVFSGVD